MLRSARALLALALLSCGWSGIVRAELPVGVFFADASLPEAPLELGFLPVAVGVDFERSFADIEMIKVHARFTGDLWDPGEQISFSVLGLVGTVGLTVSNGSDVSLQETTVSLAGFAKQTLMNGIGSLSIGAPNGTVRVASLRIEIHGTPVPTGADIADFAERAAAQGELIGVGPGRSAPNRLRALGNMIASVDAHTTAGEGDDACSKLDDVMDRIDGKPRPGDFATGPALGELWTLLAALRRELECDVVTWSFVAEVTTTRPVAGSPFLAALFPFAVGQTWEGTVSFDPTTRDLQPNQSIGTYREAIVGFELWNEVGWIVAQPIRREGSFIDVTTQPGFVSDRLSMTLSRTPAEVVLSGGESEFVSSEVGLLFQDRDGLIFGSDQLPLGPPPIQELEVRGGSIELSVGGGIGQASFVLRSIASDPDPL